MSFIHGRGYGRRSVIGICRVDALVRSRLLVPPFRFLSVSRQLGSPVAVPRLPRVVTQAEHRRARSRAALLEATARGIPGARYGDLVLEEVAAAAGYTRGALYHQFRDKDALVLATLDWVYDTWYAEVGSVFDEELPPLEALVENARRHAVYCRRDIARMMVALRVEFSVREHPVGDAVRAQTRELLERVRRLIVAGRRDGSIASGPRPAFSRGP